MLLKGKEFLSIVLVKRVRLTYPESTLELEVWAVTRNPLLPLRAEIIFEFKPFMTPNARGSFLQLS